MRASSLSLVAAAVALLLSTSVQAQSAEERLRSQLKQTTLDLRAAQDELATLRSQQAALKAQAEAAVAAPPPKPAAPAVNAQTERRLREQAAQIAELKAQLEATQQSLAKWQAGYREAAEAVRVREEEVVARRAEQAQATDYATNCSARNARLVEIGRELLERYENKGVFASLLDQEPITQLHRITLEEQVQDYQARIKDNTQPAVALPDPAAPQ